MILPDMMEDYQVSVGGFETERPQSTTHRGAFSGGHRCGTVIADASRRAISFLPRGSINEANRYLRLRLLINFFSAIRRTNNRCSPCRFNNIILIWRIFAQVPATIWESIPKRKRTRTARTIVSYFTRLSRDGAPVLRDKKWKEEKKEEIAKAFVMKERNEYIL